MSVSLTKQAFQGRKRRSNFYRYRCGRKRGFRFRSDAVRAMQSLLERGESDLHVYRHERCGGFHVGHKPAFT